MEFITVEFGWEGLIILFQILILFIIALLHFYWALGGKWGFEKSVPSKEDGTLLFHPTPSTCFAVGIGLILMIGFIFSGIIHSIYAYIPEFENTIQPSPIWIHDYGFWALGGIFTLRAIGDFNYVGFFKKVKNTSFGKLDSKFYSPLCLLIGGIFFWMAYTVQT
ncbi:MAG: DUF3995 domain-containing protein [Saprospiraceae bacterium]